MLFIDIFAAYFEMYTTPINVLCGYSWFEIKSVWYTQLFCEWSKLSFCAEIPTIAHTVSDSVH